MVIVVVVIIRVVLGLFTFPSPDKQGTMGLLRKALSGIEKSENEKNTG